MKHVTNIALLLTAIGLLVSVMFCNISDFQTVMAWLVASVLLFAVYNSYDDDV